MFASVIPGTSPSDAQGALAILQTVSSDKRYKERLQELIKAAEEADQALTNLHTAKQNTEDKLAAAETMRAAIEADAQQILADAKAAQAKADQAGADLRAREEMFIADVNKHLEAVKATRAELAEAKKAQAATHDRELKDLDRRNRDLNTAAKELDIAVGHLITNQATVADIKGKIAKLVK